MPYRIVLASVLLAWVAGAAVLAGGPAAGTGRIEGHVRLVVSTEAPVPSGMYPSRRVSRPAPPGSEMSRVVVFLKDIPARESLATANATIQQNGESFAPGLVAITRGSTVDFPNFDPFFHNVFSLSKGSPFDLGRYARGSTRSRKFTAAGLVKVYCHLHSHMSASIMVFDHPYYRIPSAEGRLTLDDVPAGTYRISAWHERIGESMHDVRVEAGRTARVEFVLPVATR